MKTYDVLKVFGESSQLMFNYLDTPNCEQYVYDCYKLLNENAEIFENWLSLISIDEIARLSKLSSVSSFIDVSKAFIKLCEESYICSDEVHGKDDIIDQFYRLLKYWLTMWLEKESQLCTSSTSKQIPDELTSDEAKRWLQVAIDGGLLNEDYSPTDKVRTKALKALLAEILSVKIFGGTNRFRTFELLWGVNGLSKQRYQSKNFVGTVRGEEQICNVFPDEKRNR